MGWSFIVLVQRRSDMGISHPVLQWVGVVMGWSFIVLEFYAEEV